ncbi:MAG TPA: cell division protein FtsA [Ktedonobacterales bacterium]|jgi:cell division protein FtsA|nr:cell division protein FtsA [Ktedonobacterales bacterium]
MKDRERTRSLAEREATIVSLDLGSQTIKALMAVIEQDGGLTFIAGGEFPSAGIREGMVSAPEQANAALVAALDTLERASGMRVMSAYVSVGGSRVRSYAAHAETKVTQPDQEISLREVEQVVGAARTAQVGDGHSEQLHVIPRSYSIDGVGGIPNPVGMVGFELAVDACIVTAPLSVTQNLVRLLHDTETEPDDLIAGPLAANASVRDQASSGLPCAVVDIGAQTTGVSIYADGAIARCDCLPLGGDAITRQMAHKLRLPFDVAETLKRRYATCLPSDVTDDDLIEMNPVSGSDELLPAKVLAESAADGAQELALALRSQLHQAQRQGLYPATLLLTGGGAELGGLDALLASATQIPALVARPEGIVGTPPPLSRPAFAVATGLLLLGARQRRRTMKRPVVKSAPLIGELRRIFTGRGPGADHAPHR